MINKLFGRVLGFLLPGKVTDLFKGLQTFFSGKKTYIAATVLLLEAVNMIVDQFTGLKNMGGLYEMIRNFGASEGFVRLAEAMAVFGLRAALPLKK